jgi:orotidine-5'-phosphate decarboxylase
MPLTTHDRLIVALDVTTADAARALVQQLGAACNFYKIGLELVTSGGIELVRDLKDMGKQVFLDLKLLDIGNTVERATSGAARLGASFLTVHGLDRKTVQAAVAGRGNTDLKLLAVTVLTSLTTDDLKEQGIDMVPSDLVLRRARIAFEAGFNGAVASGHEAPRIREAFGPGFIIVTPGIRLAGANANDQQRFMTPSRAIRAGADYLVVGRPITQADNPRAVTETILQEMEAAISGDRT